MTKEQLEEACFVLSTAKQASFLSAKYSPNSRDWSQLRAIYYDAVDRFLELTGRMPSEASEVDFSTLNPAPWVRALMEGRADGIKD